MQAGYVLLAKGPVHHSNYCLEYAKYDNEISLEVKICSDKPDEIELKFRILAIGKYDLTFCVVPYKIIEYCKLIRLIASNRYAPLNPVYNCDILGVCNYT